MHYKLEVTLSHPDLDTREPVCVEFDHDSRPAGGGFGYVAEAVRLASTKVAARSFDYDTVVAALGDSGYLDAVQKVASLFRVEGVRHTPGPDQAIRKFLVDGVYADFPEGGTWGDFVDAVNGDDARLVASFAMAMACRNETNEPPTVGDFESFVDSMEDQHITAVIPLAITADDAAILIKQLTAAGKEMIAAYGNCGSPRQQQAADALAAAVASGEEVVARFGGGQSCPSIAA